MRRIALICIWLLPSMALGAPWDMDSIASIFAGRQPDPIEGLWQFPADGASILIEKKTATTYDLIIIDSPEPDVRPGTVIGRAVTTPAVGTYDAHLDAKPLRNSRLKKANAALTLADGHLCFRPYSTGKRIAFWRWVPYFFRISILDNDSRPGNLDGADKIYPIDDSSLHPCL